MTETGEKQNKVTKPRQVKDAMKSIDDDGDRRETKQGDEASSSEDHGEDTSIDEYEDTSFDEYEDTSSDEYEDTSCNEYEDTSSDEEYINEDMSENQKNALKKFELLVVVNLKEVSQCQSLQDVISQSFIFSGEQTALTLHQQKPRESSAGV